MPEDRAKPFRIEIVPCRENPRVVVLELAGFLDAHTQGDFEKAVEKQLDLGFTAFVLDTNRLDFISSAGIGSLMALSKRLKKSGGDLFFLNPPDRIYAILDLLGFTKVQRFVENTREALEILKQKS